MTDGVLVLTNTDIEGLATMAECLEVTEEAYREFGHQIAQVIPRRRIHLPLFDGDIADGRGGNERL